MLLLVHVWCVHGGFVWDTFISIHILVVEFDWTNYGVLRYSLPHCSDGVGISSHILPDKIENNNDQARRKCYEAVQYVFNCTHKYLQKYCKTHDYRIFSVNFAPRLLFFLTRKDFVCEICHKDNYETYEHVFLDGEENYGRFLKVDKDKDACLCAILPILQSCQKTAYGWSWILLGYIVPTFLTKPMVQELKIKHSLIHAKKVDYSS